MPKNCKTLECERCGMEVTNVSLDAVSVLCWKCSLKLINKNVDETINGTTNTEELSESPGND